MWAAARRDPASPSTRSRWTASNHGSRSKTRIGRKFSALHRNWTRRFPSASMPTSLFFRRRLNHLQMNALQSAQNSDSFRLQQLYQSIRNLEASLANKRRALGVQRKARLVSRLIRSPQPRTMQLAVKIATAVESRSLRELQSLLFKLKRQYRTLHKRYSQIYGFSSYAHRNDQYQQMSQRASLSL